MTHAYTFSLALTFGLMIGGAAKAQVTFSEGFDDLAGNGWTVVNNSNPMGTTMWSQGQGGVGVDAGHSGDATSYVEDTYTATTDAGSGTISDWLISPATMIDNGDSISLWTISYNSATYADRVEVRISPNGGNSVGADESSVGDFTNLVFTINADLDNTTYPNVAVDGDTWSYFGGVVSGLNGASSCRIAVRYYITDGGGTGTNGSSVGIDDVTVTSNVVGIEEIALKGVSISPNPTLDRVNVALPAAGNYSLDIMDAIGRKVLSQNITSNQTLDLTSFTSGVYLLEVRDLTTTAVSRQRVVKN